MNIEELKKEKSYSYECNMNKEEYSKYRNHDEWGCAFVWLEDKDVGAEYNFCFDSGNSYCAIYKAITNSDGYLETDYSEYEHYDIDFDNDNWQEELENAMCEALIGFFKL